MEQFWNDTGTILLKITSAILQKTCNWPNCGKARQLQVDLRLSSCFSHNSCPNGLYVILSGQYFETGPVPAQPSPISPDPGNSQAEADL